MWLTYKEFFEGGAVMDEEECPFLDEETDEEESDDLGDTMYYALLKTNICTCFVCGAEYDKNQDEAPQECHYKI
jgi:hypothetical protein